MHFRPRIVTSLENYNRQRLIGDLGAGATVGVVALPLAMAFAIASGLPPQSGLWTAIIGGALVALLGGSNVQIAGPAGAFIVIVYGIVQRHGVGGLLVATCGAGLLLMLMGMLRLGNLVRFVPVSIIIGFTNGIAVLIALSQLKDALGLPIAKMPGDFFGQMQAIGGHLPQWSPAALALSLGCVALLFVWPYLLHQRSPIQRLDGVTVRTFARLPAPVVALVALTALSYVLKLPVETIGSRFGGIPQELPTLVLPELSWDSARRLLMPTITIAALGAIESLLCARVADQLATAPSHRKHDPNQELLAQGAANFFVPFLGGMPVTGTIARTVTNLRSGATSPVSGLVHSLMLMLIVLLAAPLAVHVPLAVLAGILLFVAWNMGEWHEFVRLRQFSNHYRLLLLGTFFLTVVFDLMVAVEVGLVLACVLFVRRMATLFKVHATSADGLHWRLHGALFFGATDKLDVLMEAAQTVPAGSTLTLDMAALFSLDTTGVDALEQLHKTLAQHGAHLALRDMQPQVQSLLERSGLADKLAPSE
ncbi:C4-dicarboxylic acid transporter DauA [uncultured Comamonas sp.]|nr:C4-dicarboxylic acid transporter DauA [uncultured Comamonas sp.]